MKTKIIILSIFIIIAQNSSLFANSINKQSLSEADSTLNIHTYYLSLGFGKVFKSFSNQEFLYFDYNLPIKINYQYNSNIISLMYMQNKELGIFLEKDEINISNVVGINYGRTIFSFNKLDIIPYIGINCDFGNYRDLYHRTGTFGGGYWTRKAYFAYGIYSELNFMYKINKYLAFDIAIFTNINKTINIVGLKTSINIWKL